MSDVITTPLIGFLFGLVVGASTLIVFVAILLRSKIRQLYLKNKDFFDKIMTPPPGALPPELEQQPGLNETVLLRLKKASELTRRQNEISTTATQPSINSLHSKHKNTLVNQYRELEKEKMTILKSIVKDGFNPSVTIFNTATRQYEEMLLSHFLTNYTPDNDGEAKAATVTNIIKTDPKGNTETEEIRKIEKNGKIFFVVEGGKNKKPTTH